MSSSDIGSLGHASSIPENSIFRKAIVCIPVVGVFLAVFNENSLKEKLPQTDLIPEKVQLIEIKNHYKIAGIIRELLFIAIIATLMATGILHGQVPLAMGGVCVTILIGALALNGYNLHHNRQLIKELSTNKLKEGMRVK